MASFDVVRRSSLPVDAAWARVTDWRRHGDFLPLTSVSVSGPNDAVGTTFVARTSIWRLGFDDPMHVTVYEPPRASRPGYCQITKTGRVVSGWAQLTIAAAPGGSLVHWHEEAAIPRAGRWLDLPNRMLGTFFFGRLIDGLLR